MGVGLDPGVGLSLALIVSVEPGDPIVGAVGAPAASEGTDLTLGAGEPQATRPITAAIAGASKTDQPCRRGRGVRRNRINGNNTLKIGYQCRPES
jgi:hypothetical protein